MVLLDAQDRDIIDLVYYQEKLIEEVAEIVGISNNAVKTRVFYARKRLSHLLQLHGVVDV